MVGLAPHPKLTGVRTGDARHHAQQSGFSRAVGSQESHDSACLHLQIQRGQRHMVAERLANALGVEDGVGHGHENMSRTLSKKPRSSWSGSG